MVLTPTLPHRWPGNPARRRPLVASTREDVPFRHDETNLIREGRPRGIFLGPWAHLATESNMKSMGNDQPGKPDPDAEREKPSRAAEYIAALYVALVLLTPWLLRDAPFFAPAKGVEIQMSKQALPPHARDAAPQPAPQGAVKNVPARAN
jgi:hypothetical protein